MEITKYPSRLTVVAGFETKTLEIPVKRPTQFQSTNRKENRAEPPFNHHTSTPTQLKGGSAQDYVSLVETRVGRALYMKRVLL